MQGLSTTVSDNEVLRLISPCLAAGDYLVGGSVRDFLLGTAPVDYDILTFTDVWDKAVSIGNKFCVKPFWMDEARGIARIVSADGITLDVCAPKGATIDEDLANRDITINAIALNLFTKEIHDPMKGIADLRNKAVRAVSENGLRDDPLRTLRCLRFAAVLGFAITPETNRLIALYAPGLRDVAPERIKQEIASALTTVGGVRIFGLMQETGIREVLFPGYDDIYQGVHHRWPLIKHAILAAETADMLIAKSDELMPGSVEMLGQEVEDRLDRASLLRFAAFLHDIGKPSTRMDADNGMVHFHGHAGAGSAIAGELCRNLKFSSSFCSRITGLIDLHMRVLDLACGGIITQKAMHRLIRSAEGFVPELLLLSLSDAIATGKDPGYKGARTEIEEIIRRIWFYYTDVYLKNRAQPLIKGDDVMAALGIQPGPKVGRLLAKVEEARAEGHLSNRQEAIDFIKTDFDN